MHVVSAVTGDGCDALRARIEPGTTAVLLGSSGVGKSTLVNRWLGEETMATRETRVDDDEGRHTTSHRQLLVLPGGGIVIDTPGLRELQLWDVGSAALDATFADVEELAADCRFADCTHVHEPECAVLAAVESGELPGERLPQLAQAPTRAACHRAAPGRAAAQGGDTEVEAAGARGPRAGEAPLEGRLRALPQFGDAARLASGRWSARARYRRVSLERSVSRAQRPDRVLHVTAGSTR